MTPGQRTLTVLLALLLGLECLMLGRQGPPLNELRRRSREHTALQERLQSEEARSAQLQSQIAQLEAKR